MPDRGPYASLDTGIGRPRECWHVHEYGGNRLDANALRREALARGDNLAGLVAVELTHGEGGVYRTVRIAVVVDRDTVYGWRVWLLCPCCGSRRLHLYHVRRGVGCRACLRIRYREGR